MDDNVDKITEAILSTSGRSSLVLWENTVRQFGKNIEIIKKIHRKVGNHLAKQVTFTIENRDHS